AKLDAVELLTLLVEQSERLPPADDGAREAPLPPSLQPSQPAGPLSSGRAESRHQPASHPRRAASRHASHPSNTTLQSNPLVVAAALAITCASFGGLRLARRRQPDHPSHRRRRRAGARRRHLRSGLAKHRTVLG